jgi:hypothetical protein
VNYDLNAYLPVEGQRIGFNGTGGRLEVDLVDQYHGPDEAGRLVVRRFGPPPVIHVYPRLGRPYDVPLVERAAADGGRGEHGGADALIREHLFRAGTPDPLSQRAGSRAGALSTLVGVAANRSIATGSPVDIAELW